MNLAKQNTNISEDNAVDTLSHRLGDKVKGILEGFDRIVFKGILKPLAYAAGMAGFSAAQGCAEQGLQGMGKRGFGHYRPERGGV